MGRTQRFGPLLQLIILVLALAGNACSAATFTLINKCTYTVWPGLLSGAGIPQPSTTGFSLQPSSTNSLSLPSSWSGRIWARTFCSTNTTTGKFSCLTGDCGSGTVQCSGSSAVPPATLAEFTLNGSNGLDFYDVSLVDGYNLPLMVVPQGSGTGNCSATGCNVELNGSCPTQLRMTGNGTQNVGCRSACEAFGKPQYCCSGAYATPSTCKPSAYSKFFKAACPTAYSYAYDDATSTFTCAGADYVITFCPTPAATKKSSGQSPEASSSMPPTTATTTSTTTSTPFYFVAAANAPSYALLSIHLTLLSLFTASAFL